jgi:RinA family phage transcriptional activator
VKKWKVSDSDFQYIEDEVRLYPQYKERLNELIAEIAYRVPERDDSGGGRSNLPSRPVESIVFNLLNDFRIAKIRQYVNAVEQALRELDHEKKMFIINVYWREGKTIESICIQFSISQATYLRWKKAFLLRVGMLTGDKRDI